MEKSLRNPKERNLRFFSSRENVPVLWILRNNFIVVFYLWIGNWQITRWVVRFCFFFLFCFNFYFSETYWSSYKKDFAKRICLFWQCQSQFLFWEHQEGKYGHSTVLEFYLVKDLFILFPFSVTSSKRIKTQKVNVTAFLHLECQYSCEKSMFWVFGISF